jgi:NAD+ diphosphatase
VAEEVGLQVVVKAYAGSQPWPFPASLMLGFRAEAQRQELTVDTSEISDARWFTREELRAPRGFFIPPSYALASRLITTFINE